MSVLGLEFESSRIGSLMSEEMDLCNVKQNPVFGYVPNISHNQTHLRALVGFPTRARKSLGFTYSIYYELS